MDPEIDRRGRDDRREDVGTAALLPNSVVNTTTAVTMPTTASTGSPESPNPAPTIAAASVSLPPRRIRTPHGAFEAAASYWHFVGVVWVLLFVFVYWL